MDAATLYMIVMCNHTLCLPLHQDGFTMTKTECEAKALEMRLEKLRPVGCLSESEWVLFVKHFTFPPQPPGPSAH
jgi:hypothetical protein